MPLDNKKAKLMNRVSEVSKGIEDHSRQPISFVGNTITEVDRLNAPVKKQLPERERKMIEDSIEELETQLGKIVGRQEGASARQLRSLKKTEGHLVEGIQKLKKKLEEHQ